MDPRKLGLILVLVLGASLYLARRGGDLTSAYLRDGEKRTACSWLEERLLNAPYDKRSSSNKTSAELVVLKRHCWKSDV